MTAGGWFDQLGKPVSPERAEAALDLLTEQGLHRGNASLVLSVVCREIRNDNPDAAQRYLRSFIGNDETLVLRTCATLCEARS